MIDARAGGAPALETTHAFTSLAGRAARHAALLVDWDGCLAIGNRLLPAAVDFLRENQDRIAIVSNNSTDLPEDFSRVLARKGIAIPPQRIILAGSEALSLAALRKPRRAMVLGSRKMIASALRRAIPLHPTDADLVVLMRDTHLSYRRIERAANALVRGASLLVSNPDRAHPGENGRIVPETGALLAALTTCIGAAPARIDIVGKPGPHLFARACEALGVRHEDALMVGDNPDTDIAGAHALGMQAVLVRPPERPSTPINGARLKSLD